MAQHARLWQGMLGKAPDQPAPQVASPAPGDKRFDDPSWAESPVYDYLRQAYLINAEYVKRMVEAAPMADGQAKDRMRFLTRQMVDAMAPSNFLATNPEFVKTAMETKGLSIQKGIQNLIADLEKGRISMTDDSAFEVGRNLAVTPGAVVYENELMQLLQYSPQTETVAARPFLMVPPCINKYYILDLQPENSVVRYAVEQGNTVFLISWKNVQADQGHLSWDDYIEQGALQAIKVVQEICGVDQINALGFCVGGTILGSALSVAALRGENPVASLTLLTTLLDFADSGEIGCLVDEDRRAGARGHHRQGRPAQGQRTGQRVFLAARQRPDLAVRGRQLSEGQDAAGLRPAVLERRRHQPARPLPRLVPAQHVPGEQPARAGQAGDVRRQGRPRPRRHAGLHLCQPRRPHRAVEIGLPEPQPARRRDHLRARRLGPYCRRHQPGGKNKRSHWINDSATANADEWFDTATEVKGSWWPVWANWLKQQAGGELPARAKLGSKAYPPGEPAPGSYVKEKA
jgi:polyhydroxyalkanoate synthase